MDIRGVERVSGHLALDFLNTIEDRLGPEREELLRTSADLVEWGRMTGVLAPSAAAEGGDEAELGRALRLRDALTATLEAQVTGRRPDPDDLAILAAAVAEAHAAGALALDGSLRWRWSPAELASVRHTVADAAYELLGGPSAPRIGECDGPGCGWFFLDRTKRGNRRWCTMRDCGQQAKTAGRRARRGGAG